MRANSTPKKQKANAPHKQKAKTRISETVVDRISGLRDEAKEARTRYRETLYDLTQNAVLIASELLQDGSAWEDFCEADLCKEKPGESDQLNAVRYVFRPFLGVIPKQ